MDAKQFGNFIAKCRKEKNMTQADLAKCLCVSDKTISRWERGVGFPDIQLLAPLAENLEITMSELMTSKKADESPSETADREAALQKSLELAQIKIQSAVKRCLFILSIALAVMILGIAVITYYVPSVQLRVIMVGGLVLLCCLVAETIGMLRRN